VSSLVKYPINPNDNYWEVNPQVKYIKPFSEVYKLDDGGEHSSKFMYVVTFFCDPDENENKFFRMSEEVRKKNLEEFYPEMDWEDPLFQECLEAYPFECMNSIQRSLKEQLDSMKERTKLITSTERTLDHYLQDDEGNMIYDKSGKPIFVKGTAKQIDDLQKTTRKIYEDLEILMEKFMSQKAEDVRVRGGRKRTAHEKGLV